MGTQEENRITYVPPCVACVEVAVETGFEASVGSGANESFGTEEGVWDDML